MGTGSMRNVAFRFRGLLPEAVVSRGARGEGSAG